MNGAESLVRTLVASGVDVCFTNPGTSEMHFVASLDAVPEMRAVLALFEGVAAGAADGWARMTGRPAATLFHLGPGLGNAIANLHNARRASTPMVNIVGDHATYHLQYDAPLASDLAGIARPVSGWFHSSSSARTVAADAARAVAAARTGAGQIATLVLPADTAWDEAAGPATPIAPPVAPVPDDAAIARVATLLRNGMKTAILMRGRIAQAGGLALAGRVAAATGADLLADTFMPRQDRGAGVVAVTRIPYFAEQATEMLAKYEQIVLVGAKPPVSFFAYPGKASWLAPEGCTFAVLAHEHEDAVAGMAALADVLGAPAQPAGISPLRIDEPSADRLNAYTAGNVIASLLPEGAIVIEEGGTSGGGAAAALATAAPHTALALTGGAIGIGMPLALGAAIACPDRKVVNLEGDGSGMYTLQALWSQARENTDTVTIVYSNRSYSILKVELGRVGAPVDGHATGPLFSLDNPALDWVSLAAGMGVEGSRATTLDQFRSQLASAMRVRGPRLIEVVL